MSRFSSAFFRRSALALGIATAALVPLLTPGTANAYWYHGYGWHGYGWHGYGWRAYGWRPYGYRPWGWRPGVVVVPPVVVARPPAFYVAP